MADLRPVYVAGDGDVKGPASASNNFLPLFADTTGKLLKSSGTGVTAQGLAILDDNTPAEQRNTIGLDQVNNTSDINKPVSTVQQTALNLKADLASPALTGSPTAPSPPVGSSSLLIATAQFVTAAITSAINTLQAAVNSALGLKAPISSPVFTGSVTADTGSIRVASGAALWGTPGLSMSWNVDAPGYGRSEFVTNRAAGEGGFQWRSVNANNTEGGPAMIYDYAGNLTVSGDVNTGGVNTGGVVTKSKYAFRSVQGNYGTLFFNDGNTFYIMLTNSGDQYGGYSSLRPFSVSLSTGKVYMGNGLDVVGGINSNGDIVSSGLVYSGGSYLNTDGDLFGTRWGGWLSNWVAGNFLGINNVGTATAALGLSSVGTYAFARLITGATTNQGGLVNGSNLLYSSTNNANGTSSNSGLIGGGTWRCQGAQTATERTLWLRVA